MSAKINKFKHIFINASFYCTYVNLIEQPLFCQLEIKCAKGEDEKRYLEVEYARRYIRVMLAQRTLTNNPFNSTVMQLCETIAHPYAEMEKGNF
jgi:hypothetical protein